MYRVSLLEADVIPDCPYGSAYDSSVAWKDDNFFILSQCWDFFFPQEILTWQNAQSLSASQVHQGKKLSIQCDNVCFVCDSALVMCNKFVVLGDVT